LGNRHTHYEGYCKTRKTVVTKVKSFGRSLSHEKRTVKSG